MLAALQVASEGIQAILSNFDLNLNTAWKLKFH